MRRVYVAAAVCAAFWLVAGPATAAPRDLPARGHDLAHPTLDAGARTAEPAAARARIAPLAGRGSAAMVTISGYVFNSSGAPVPEATVEWSAQGYYNTAVTDASGYWVSQALPATGDGQLWVYLPDGGAMARQGESFVEGASFTFDPGSLSVTGYRGGPWGDFDDITVRLWGTTRFTRGRVATADTSTTPVTGNFDAMSGSYASGTVHFFSDEGMEFSGAFNVTPYTWSGGTATAYEADAQRITVASPYWASGAPGTVVKVARGNFTPGWVNHVTGASEFPDDAQRTDWGSATSTSTSTQFLRLKVPKTATPGYWYNIGMSHENSPGALYLETPFQVCTMKPSRTSVHRGARIRVAGVVPIYGHWGEQAGTPKSVTLYAHKGKAGVPTKWNPKRQGWVKVGSVKTDEYGAYRTPYFKPLKTLTLVVRYPGDDWWWDAYTSAKKITVR